MGEIISPRNCYVLVTLRHKGNNFATQLAFLGETLGKLSHL